MSLVKDLYGPLTDLIGVWEGDKGLDIVPSDDRGTEENLFRERIVFEQMSPVQNHEQTLNVLRYSTMVYRIGQGFTFHEELGYWSWEPKTQEIMRCFLVPRGIALIAGGKADKDAKEFRLEAKAGSPTFGICNNPFLEREFKTVSFEYNFKFLDKDRFSYEEDSVLKMPGKSDLFHHKDKNALKRVG